ncbi:MAG TPA: 30S ribosomal protein S12 methylthiotransferase RimO [Chitinophagales bacterium]|nr:30S ribosomal protein S12 methylthiotransferase RimO [Chitinophagales bacterium]HMU98121.1 30S ribosomal protein S12 methylthiotransferase RimO [Chitinophagales bacterium]HMV02994.1 30S ribosomal protein S12 methylthiotransferase RimO [Chitinophagales bacterium]HMW94541.1 30S ribosomal protein S12 methylthiotransferase RimO [Chitinophagales bacterium]HMY42772.1 30S ribosomal protein S12 methylthiotransferase RimO [Chitinophagales bacterium]
MKVRTNKKDKVNVITLGCSKNLVDSEVLIGHLKHNQIDVEHQSEKNNANIIVINTCGFIDRAKEESINTILDYADLKEKGKIDKLYVTGCLSHRYKDDLEKEIPAVDAYFGTNEMPYLLKKFKIDYQHELIGERFLTTPKHFAYLKISEGCNRTCSFCAIPLMRGGHISKSIEDVVTEAKALAAKGVREIILIAQELTYYGLDIYKKRALADLLYQLNELEGIEWIRLHYAYPSKFPIEIIEAIKKCNKVCDYLDIPLQHANNAVLDRMKRQITQEETRALIHEIRKIHPDIAIRTTMLVGFPGETEAEFEDLCSFVKEMRFERLGVFQYSHEDGTAAYELEDDVDTDTKEERASILMQIQQEISMQKNEDKIGKEYRVLIDRKESGYFVGRTEYDSPEVDNEVLINAEKFYCRLGDFTNVVVTDATDFDLYADVIE